MSSSLIVTNPEIIKALEMTQPKPPPKEAVGRPRIAPKQKLLNKIASNDRWRENNRTKVLLDNRIRSANYYSIVANKIKAREYYKKHYSVVTSY